VKIIVDTNVVFSALLRTHTIFGQVIFNSHGIFEFYSPHYLKTEIRKHWDKIKRISKLTDHQLEESYDSLLTKINFINEEIIPQKIWEDSEKITSETDIDDTDFVALTKHLKGKLWTGDIRLKNGLRKNGFKMIVATSDILKLWTKKRSSKL
jgi:predicted nucleic acid-binding protein